MTNLVACTGCGRPVDQAQSFFGAAGLLCPSCHMQQQNLDVQENLVRREARSADQRVSRSTRYLARLHAVMWVTFVIPVAANHQWFWASLAVVAGLAFGLAARHKWAYWGAVGVDATAIAAAVDWGAFHHRDSTTVAVCAFVAICGTLLLVLTLSLRAAFTGERPKDPLAL